LRVEPREPPLGLRFNRDGAAGGHISCIGRPRRLRSRFAFGSTDIPTMSPDPGPVPGKILPRADLLRLRAAARAAGRKVVHCHGCFDIVHPGHIRHLRYAKALGDILFVSITGDAEIKKGTGRPLIPEELRAESLAALDFVDWVYIEPRATAEGLLGELHPDV